MASFASVNATRPVYVASDVHLGATPPEQERAFLAWLEHAASEAGRIVLIGDLFDFWFEYLWGPTRGYDEVLGRLRSVVDSGVPVTLMGGNHDWWGGRFLTEEVGLEFLRAPVTRELAGHRTLLAHGDGLGRGDLGYRLMRPVLRSTLTCWAFRLLPPALGDRVAGRASRTEQRWSGPSERQKARARALEEWAVSALETRPDLDLIILGHAHVPAFVEVAPGRWYVNAGDWVFRRTYLVLEPGRDPLLTEWGATCP